MKYPTDTQPFEAQSFNTVTFLRRTLQWIRASCSVFHERLSNVFKQNLSRCHNKITPCCLTYPSLPVPDISFTTSFDFPRPMLCFFMANAPGVQSSSENAFKSLTLRRYLFPMETATQRQNNTNPDEHTLICNATITQVLPFTRVCSQTTAVATDMGRSMFLNGYTFLVHNNALFEV